MPPFHLWNTAGHVQIAMTWCIFWSCMQVTGLVVVVCPGVVLAVPAAHQKPAEEQLGISVARTSDGGSAFAVVPNAVDSAIQDIPSKLCNIPHRAAEYAHGMSCSQTFPQDAAIALLCSAYHFLQLRTCLMEVLLAGARDQLRLLLTAANRGIPFVTTM